MKNPFPSHIARRATAYILLGCLALVATALLLSSRNSSSALPRTRVLFVGNSLTSANDLPGMLAKMAGARGHCLEYDVYAPGGYRLSQHVSDAALKGKIERGNWDFVVLQEQSQLPAFEDQRLTEDVFPNAQKLCEMIRLANPKAKVAFYMTMAKKDGDSENAPYVPGIGTYEGMQERLKNSYTTMARQNLALLIPAGTIWKNVRSDKPAISLYADEAHPNVTGTYLVACAFYAVLFNDTPVGLTHPQQVDGDIATYLQNMTARAVRTQ